MRTHRHLLLATLAGLALAGCGGGSTGGGQVQDPLASGRAALNRVASGASASDTTTLQGILAMFQQAIQQKPDSTEAHFGAALCLAGLAGNDLDGGPTPTELANTTVPSSRPGVGFAAPVGAVGSSPGSPGSGGHTILPAPPISGEVPPAPPGHTLPVQPLPPKHRLSLLWNIDSGLANPYTLLNMLAPLGSLQYGLIPFYGYSQDTSDVARRQKLLGMLDQVVQNLQVVEANPDFSTTLPDPNNQGQTVAVGLPEVYLFDAYVNSLRAEVALSLAYARDPGDTHLVPRPRPANGSGPGTAPQPAIFAKGSPGGGTTGSGGGGTGIVVFPPDPGSQFRDLDKNKDGKLTPDEYLPPSPYLTLRDAAFLTKAQQAMTAVADLETKGIAGVLARATDSVFLVSNTDEVRQLLTEVRDHVLPLIKQAAVGPVTFELPYYTPLALGGVGSAPPPPSAGSNQGGVFSIAPRPATSFAEPTLPPIFTTEKVTFNLAAWFKLPPTDLKAFAPVYTLDSNGFPDPTLTKYPDSTFGGLYPDGLPSNFAL